MTVRNTDHGTRTEPRVEQIDALCDEWDAPGLAEIVVYLRSRCETWKRATKYWRRRYVQLAQEIEERERRAYQEGFDEAFRV